jgi:CheY-like chemotaxis protein
MTPKRILVVDDEVGFTRLLKLTLEHTGRYEVREVNDGTQARAVAREFKPDLVLLDIVMPKIDGGDVAAQLQADSITCNTAIVFLTAIVSQKESDKDNIGGFPFIGKPISVDALVETIEEHLPKEADEATG